MLGRLVKLLLQKGSFPLDDRPKFLGSVAEGGRPDRTKRYIFPMLKPPSSYVRRPFISPVFPLPIRATDVMVSHFLVNHYRNRRIENPFMAQS
ncbi:hypothetical protein M514_16273 [Trichuris suis]|uniref:Uncharacterized protein n=1 Tax=Trichuris suis TaxID=68888 RepID=A0A085NPE5_9BILA|nr:hypothetical protein M514_16273 [Trichuris suis]